MVGIVDYNMGNLASVLNAFSSLGEDAQVESDPDKLSQYERLILPGVGAFGDAMEHLRERGMDEAVKNYAQSGKPMMGICLGMQLLFDEGEEFGNHSGLGLIPGVVKEFNKNRFEQALKVPHMGWNQLFKQKNSALFNGLDESFYLYFVHSFHVECEDEYVIGKSEYGYPFVSAVNRDNIYGIQPHPEKSHENGLKILQNFLKIKE